MRAVVKKFEYGDKESRKQLDTIASTMYEYLENMLKSILQSQTEESFKA